MVTIKEVAELAGVPEKTVMRALSGKIMGKRRDARERAERVRKAAEELGYVPSSIASSLRKGKTRTIGLLAGYITNRYYASLVETVMDECEKLDYRVQLELTRGNNEKNLDCLSNFRRARVDGILYASWCCPAVKGELLRLKRSGLPVMFQRERDYSNALCEAVAELKERGFQEITIAFWHGGAAGAKEEIELQCGELLREAGFVCRYHELHSLADAEALAELEPQALICDSPHSLKHFYKMKRSGYEPAVIGMYDEWNVIDHSDELMGIILAPSEELVRCAVRELIDIIEGREPEDVHFTGRYYPRKLFGNIVLKDLFAQHLQEL